MPVGIPCTQNADCSPDGVCNSGGICEAVGGSGANTATAAGCYTILLKEVPGTIAVAFIQYEYTLPGTTRKITTGEWQLFGRPRQIYTCSETRPVVTSVVVGPFSRTALSGQELTDFIRQYITITYASALGSATVTIENTPNGSVTLKSGILSGVVGRVVELDAEPNSGYKLLRWEVTGQNVLKVFGQVSPSFATSVQEVCNTDPTKTSYQEVGRTIYTDGTQLYFDSNEGLPVPEGYWGAGDGSYYNWTGLRLPVLEDCGAPTPPPPPPGTNPPPPPGTTPPPPPPGSGGGDRPLR